MDGASQEGSVPWAVSGPEVPPREARQAQVGRRQLGQRRLVGQGRAVAARSQVLEGPKVAARTAEGVVLLVERQVPLMAACPEVGRRVRQAWEATRVSRARASGMV